MRGSILTWLALLLGARSAAGAPVVTVRDGQIVVTVASTTPLGTVSMRSERGVIETATSIRALDEPITIALVVSAWSEWIGTDELPDGSHDPGALRSLEHAIDATHLASVGPVGSKAVVILYGDRVQVQPIADLELLRGKTLGEQHDYDRVGGELLSPALQVALDQLRAADTPRKAMIVLGDGYDMAVSPVSPEVIGRRARAEDVVMFAILWRPPRMARMYERHPRDNLTEIIPSEIRVDTPDKIEGALGAVAQQLPVRYEVMFDARALGAGTHALDLRDGEQALGTVTVDLPGDAEPRPTTFWRVWLLVATGLLVGGAISVARMRARR